MDMNEIFLISPKVRRPSQNIWTISQAILHTIWHAGTASHIRRFQEYFIHIHTLIGSTALQFLQFWYQNGVNILFLVVKPIDVTSGFISKLMKKIARWHCCWNIWQLSLITKISPLVVRYQEYNGCQKNRQDLRNSDLEVYFAKI